jgi:hypothetical protein
MKLTIKDLPFSIGMDSSDMAATRGGRKPLLTRPASPSVPQAINPLGPWNDSLVEDILDAALDQANP